MINLLLVCAIWTWESLWITGQLTDKGRKLKKQKPSRESALLVNKKKKIEFIFSFFDKFF